MNTETVPEWPGAAAIRAHVERYIGPIAGVFDARSGVQVLHSAPTQTRPFHTLITCGMSSKEMPVPAGKDAPRRLELMATLPEDWEKVAAPPPGEPFSWPLRLLGSLAALLEEPGRWLGWGQVIPNGDPPLAYAGTTKLCASIIAPSLMVPVAFYELGSGPDRVAFYSAIPLYAEELELHRSEGMESLLSRLLQRDVNDVIHPKRRNAARRFFGLF